MKAIDIDDHLKHTSWVFGQTTWPLLLDNLGDKKGTHFKLRYEPTTLIYTNKKRNDLYDFYRVAL